MSWIKEFKEFAMRGNVVDLAIGVVMGTAFGKIVNALTANVIMPVVGYLIAGVNFSDLKYDLPAIQIAGKEIAPATIQYGMFIQATFDFVVVAFCMFLLVKAMNRMLAKREAAPAAPPEPPADVKLLSEIRDLLKAR